MSEAAYPFMQARDYYKGRRKPIRHVIVHATATGESSRVAETIQRTWATDDGRLASAHLICDNDSTVRCVHDADTAWHAKGANSDGLGVEVVGQATQDSVQWNDVFSKAAVRRAALATGEWCHRYRIPVRRLTIAQLRDGTSRGIAGHADVQKAWPSSGHTDPGPNFPWASFLSQARDEFYRLEGPPAWYTAPRRYYNGPDIDKVRGKLGLPLHAGFDRELAVAILAYRDSHGLSHTPLIDEALARKLGA